ncbi:hypothetical protein [Neoroseomonas soli]|uniref:Uncharacterized protein n=1 Tax=Neoroseomonas soli TaxID=1081025 RepID=A0A9X9WVD7_9PROT|nr:hypothetical protein [Neoroseomonas soli]MBR0671116.1 hypothetical protein [Neoroseomonas soli]
MSAPVPSESPATETNVTTLPLRPEDRLRLALRRLEQAIGEQSEATKGLRSAIGDLSCTMARLGEGVAGYRGALDTTAAEIERALAAARTLQATADRMAV